MAVPDLLVLRPGDRDRLSAILAEGLRASLRRRAEIVLLAADGVSNSAIASATGSSRPTVLLWRRRYQLAGMAGLSDRPRHGRPVETNEPSVLLTTIIPRTGPGDDVSPWTARSLSRAMGLSPHTVLRIWRKWGIENHQTEAVPLDPPMPTDVHSVIGLFLSASQQCVALSGGGRALMATDILGSATFGVHGGADAAESAEHGDMYVSIVESLQGHGQRRVDEWLVGGHRAEFSSFVEALSSSRTHTGHPIHLVCAERPHLDSFEATLAASGSLSIRIHTPPDAASWCDALELVISVVTAKEQGRLGFVRAAGLRSAVQTKIESWQPSGAPFRWVAPTATGGPTQGD